MHWKLFVGALVAVSISALTLESGRESPESEEDGDSASPTKPTCSSCSSSQHFAPPISLRELDRLIEEYAGTKVGTESAALDSLLYHTDQASQYLEKHDSENGLDEAHATFLRNELSKKHATVSFRIIDDRGKIRSTVYAQRVPFGVKQHLHSSTRESIQDMEFNGTLKRVGLHHIWARF